MYRHLVHAQLLAVVPGIKTEWHKDFELVGASLSEPSTRWTAMQDACVHVCMSACGHIVKISIEQMDTEGKVHFKFAHVLVKGYCQSGPSVTWI